MTSVSIYTYNLRFPGQYSLNESGLYYNYFRDYDPQTGRYIESDPIGLRGGINSYGFVGANPISRRDPFGLATVIIVGGPTPTNPFGHVSMATTGSGIYSFGTLTPYDSSTPTGLGSSVTNFVLDQSRYRDSTAYIINTTPDQEAAILADLQSQTGPLPHVPGPDSSDTCASRSNHALRRGRMYDLSNPYSFLYSSPLPEASAMIGSFYSRVTGGSVVTIPMGSQSIPQILNQFNPH
jgi:RHS repeat-associated protein